MPGNAAAPLNDAIRWPILGRHLGQLALVLCILTLPPLAVALHGGDGSRPAIQREADPEHTDFLSRLSGNDQSNIIASLVGRCLGFRRVVTRLEDPEFEHICIELGLEDSIVPARTIGRYLADMFSGHDMLELSAMLKDEARVFAFVVTEAEAGPVADLHLPHDARVVCCHRDDKFILPEADFELAVDDEVVVITHSRNLPTLETRWGARKPTRRDH
jgi:trk system potassium uptake protein TrkA